MRYRIVFREITRNDLDRHCLFMPEPHEFEMRFRAIVEDAAGLEGVIEVNPEGTHAIVIEADVPLEVMKERFVPLLRHHWAHMRPSSFDLLSEGQG